MPKYADLVELSEDSRIKAIGENVMTGMTVGVFLEKDEAKIARYIRKVTTRYPDVVVLDQADGPTPLIVTVKFGLRRH
jgi:hypothetical protein